MSKTILIAFVVLYACAYKVSAKLCGSLTKVNCYEKAAGSSLQITELIHNGRNDIDWSNYERTIASILCECKKLAEEGGYNVIGLQYYGECWGSKEKIEDVISQLTESNKCLNGQYKECSKDGNSLCMGTDQTTAVYIKSSTQGMNDKVDGKYSDWSAWSDCSKTCNQGIQERSRSCDSPAPEHGGRQCSEYLGESEEVRQCTLKECENSNQNTGAFNCKSKEEGEEFTTLSTMTTFNPKAPFCGVPAQQEAKTNDKYTVSVDMYCVTDGPARAGIFFNAQDEENYNFVYIHLNSDFYCYHTGRVENGVSNWQDKTSGQCNRVFRTNSWITLKVKVDGSKARLYGNSKFIVEWNINSKDTGKGGFIVKNGLTEADQTEIHIKDLDIK